MFDIMQSSNNSDNDVKLWLTVALAKEELEDLSIEIVGGSAKGDGYAGEIIFVRATGTDKNKSQKVYNLVLKCSKANEALRKCVLQDSFLNEIYMYEKVFPTFEQFQINKGVERPFNSIPKCYGTFISDKKEIIVLENLKEIGYNLWSHDKPLPRKHVDFVVNEYGKFHALSVAIKQQKPEEYLELTKGLIDVYSAFVKSFGMIKVFESLVQESYDLLKNDLEEGILQKWLSFKDQVDFIFSKMIRDINGLEVIIHGDCWNNNFMYQYDNSDVTAISKVAMLDWQMCINTSPLLDLSYFLFASISQEDFNNVDEILRGYYNSFTSHLKKLGSNFASDYPLEQFLKEWKNYSRGGILMALLPLKIAYVEKDEIPDIGKIFETGADIASSFLFNIRNKAAFRDRVKPLVIHAVKSGLTL